MYQIPFQVRRRPLEHGELSNSSGYTRRQHCKLGSRRRRRLQVNLRTGVEYIELFVELTGVFVLYYTAVFCKTCNSVLFCSQPGCVCHCLG